MIRIRIQADKSKKKKGGGERKKERGARTPVQEIRERERG